MSVDVEELVNLSKRSREFKHQCEARIYTLRTPTDHEMRVYYLRHAADGANAMLVQREAVEGAIVGWSGVTMRDLMRDQPPAEVPFDRRLIPALLDANDNDFSELSKAVFAAYDKRRSEVEADAKN